MKTKAQTSIPMAWRAAMMSCAMKKGEILPLESIHFRMAAKQLVMNGITIRLTTMYRPADYSEFTGMLLFQKPYVR